MLRRRRLPGRSLRRLQFELCLDREPAASFERRHCIHRRSSPSRRSARPARAARAAQPDPGRLGHVRLRPRDGSGWSISSRLGGIVPKTITRAAARRQRAVADGRDARRHAQLDRAGQRRHRRLHRASPALSGERWARRSSSASPAARPTSSSRWRRSSATPPGVAAVELNISCPNVSGGVDFGTEPGDVRAARGRLPRGVPAADHRQADAQRDRASPTSPRRPRPAAPMRSR